ncbi:TPA: DUF916 and DUF3324 domain-containing protein [Enterococcus hirae]|uniref:DUF916 and DUF3324 domain-containing protein n=1 Tax=Enterococcus hirae TaxID=1354 RepID=UPI001A958123|nr:DUF916 and DUF3324 domain-containing protein [Enterococcus hirae]MBO1117042.1 DUF916 and DUF3324 domain-containing protein [Enterococcus hirae]MBO1134992.1 DUF916 and DUF3324 domain-containing protein [Enterococcus hirae]
MKKWFTYITVIAFSLFIGTQGIHAEDSSGGLMGGYTIEGIPNEHQIDKNVSYFYLEEHPNDTDQIKVKLINDSNDSKVLNIKVTNANTNSNGLVDYTGLLKDHKLLKEPLNSIVKPQKEEVTLAPKSEEIVTFDLKMPSEKQDGIILGGIVVSESKDKSEKNENMAVGNTYSYTLGVLLTNDPNVKINQNISVELENVGAILSNGRKIVQANILNPNPYIFGEATVSGKIMNEDETKVIQEAKKESVKIAPLSVFPFQFDWKKENLKPGTYIFEGLVKTSDNQWKFKKAFTITSEEANKINDESVFKVYIPNYLTYSVIIIGIITLIDTIYIILRKRKNNINIG